MYDVEPPEAGQLPVVVASAGTLTLQSPAVGILRADASVSASQGLLGKPLANTLSLPHHCLTAAASVWPACIAKPVMPDLTSSLSVNSRPRCLVPALTVGCGVPGAVWSHPAGGGRVAAFSSASLFEDAWLQQEGNARLADWCFDFLASVRAAACAPICGNSHSALSMISCSFPAPAHAVSQPPVAVWAFLPSIRLLQGKGAPEVSATEQMTDDRPALADGASTDLLALADMPQLELDLPPALSHDWMKLFDRTLFSVVPTLFPQVSRHRAKRQHQQVPWLLAEQCISRSRL